MALGSFIVKIGAEVRNYTRNVTGAKKTMKDVADSIQKDATNIKDSLDSLNGSSRVFSSFSEEQLEMMRISKAAAKAIKADYMTLAQSSKDYEGQTNQFMKKIKDLGLRHKEITDQMIQNNDKLKANFLKTIGTTLAKSNTSDGLAESIKRTHGAARGLDQMFLKLGSSMENYAKQGNAAVLALKELGPTAGMKELLKLQKQITTMTGGAQVLQLGALFVTAAEIALLVQLSNALDGRLIPAFERFKEVWAQALKPFAQAFTTAALAVLNFATYIGELFARLAETNPVLSAMIFGILALIPPLIALAAPLALGISYFGGLNAMFAVTFAAIKPVVIAFLSIIGTVLAVAAIIVTLIAVWSQMMKHSEALRSAVSNAWAQIKKAIFDALAPIIPAWEKLKAAFQSLISTFLGGSNTNESLWKRMGDAVAKFVNWFAQVAVPVIKAAFTLFASIVTTTINVVVSIINFLKKAWETNFLGIKTITMNIINNIKLVIQSGLAIIQNLFSLFNNILKGNWSAAWENVKAILSNAVTFIWNAIQLWLVGKSIALIRSFATGALNVVKGWTTSLGSTVKTGVSNVYNFIKSGFDKVINWLKGLDTTFYNAGKGFMEMMGKGITSAASAVLNSIKQIAQKARDFLPFSPAKTGPLSDLDKLDFGGPIRDSIFRAMPMVQTSMGDLLRMPTSSPTSSSTTYNNPQATIIIQGGDKNEIIQVLDEYFGGFKQTSRAMG